MKRWKTTLVLMALASLGWAIFGVAIGRTFAPSPSIAAPLVATPEPASSTICRDTATSFFVLDQTNTRLLCDVGARVIVDQSAGMVTCECPDVARSPWEVSQ